MSTRKRRVTYFELKALLNYMLKTKPEGFDLATIGIDPDNIETVRKFWDEYCYSLRYRECKEQVRKLIPKIEEWRYSEDEERHYLIAQARQYLEEKYGTSRIYELYKQLNDEEQEDYPVLYEYTVAKYNCIDVGTERITLFPLQITDNIEEFLRSFIGFSYAENVKELEDYRTRIALVSQTREAKLLFCYTKDDKAPQGFPLTSTLSEIGVIAWSKKKMAILL